MPCKLGVNAIVISNSLAYPYYRRTSEPEFMHPPLLSTGERSSPSSGWMLWLNTTGKDSLDLGTIPSVRVLSSYAKALLSSLHGNYSVFQTSGFGRYTRSCVILCDPSFNVLISESGSSETLSLKYLLHCRVRNQPI